MCPACNQTACIPKREREKSKVASCYPFLSPTVYLVSPLALTIFILEQEMPEKPSWRLFFLTHDITKLLSAILATSSIRTQCLSSRGHGFGAPRVKR